MKEPNMTEPTDSSPTESFQPVVPEPAPGLEPAPPAAGPSPAAAPPPEPALGATTPVRPVKRSTASQGLWVNVALGLALAVAVAGVAFAAGRMTAPAAAAANGLGNGGRFFNNGEFPGGGFGGANGGPGGRVFTGGGASIEGTVTAVTADSITITTTTGQTVTLAISGTTTYHQEASASASDVKTGGTVIVRLGARQPDASPDSAGQVGLNANDITVVP
jgi:hypothetical protein